MANKNGLPPKIEPMSRALRPGVQDSTSPARPKTPTFDLGTLKGPKDIGSSTPPKMPKMPRGFGRGR
jgi:hypothetical protein